MKHVRVSNHLRSFLRAAAALALVSISITASALPIELDIDFRDGSIWGGHGDHSFSYEGIELTANPLGNSLYRDNTDGYGVLGGEWDEIDFLEFLAVSFAEDYFTDPANWLTGVLLTDLFPAPDGGPNGESGNVTLLDNFDAVIAEFFVNATEYVANGEYYLDFGGAYDPSSIVFVAYVDPMTGYDGSEYSVAGFTTVGVPEPSTLLLMGIGLILVGQHRRRRLSL